MSNIDSLVDRNAAFAASDVATTHHGYRFSLIRGFT